MFKSQSEQQDAQSMYSMASASSAQSDKLQTFKDLQEMTRLLNDNSSIIRKRKMMRDHKYILD